MKLNLILICLACILCVDLATAQRIDVITMLDGKSREFIIARPPNRPPAGGTPLVFMLHGTSGDGEKFYNISGWKELGMQENFITVFPSSLRYCVFNPDSSRILITKWNNGDLQSVACPNQDIKDDVKFFRKMVDTIASILQINKEMIYVAGFSNGGVMAAKLALEMPDVFCAATCTGAFLHDLDSMRIKNKIPIWNMVGTQDSMFIERSGKPYIPFNDTCLLYLRNGIHNYLGSFGLDSSFVKYGDSILLNYEYNKPLPGESKAFFRHSVVLGMTHQYPNGINFRPMNAATLHWEFFKSSKRITTTQNEPKSANIYSYPNPFLHSFTLSSMKDTDEYFFSDLCGKNYPILVENQSIMPGNIPAQLYILTIKHKDQSIEKIKCLKIQD